MSRHENNYYHPLSRQGTGAGVFIDPNNDYPERQFEASKVQSQVSTSLELKLLL